VWLLSQEIHLCHCIYTSPEYGMFIRKLQINDNWKIICTNAAMHLLFPTNCSLLQRGNKNMSTRAIHDDIIKRKYNTANILPTAANQVVTSSVIHLP
jgi:hypothetical protein